MMMTGWVFAVLAVAACSGGGGKGPTTDPATGSDGSGSGTATAPVVAGPALSGDDAVLEAVLVHEIDAAKPAADEALCLRVRTASGSTGDASDALLAAIRARYPTAVPASACVGGGPTPVTVAATGGAGIMFDVGPVKAAPDGFSVEGGGGQRGGSSGIREVEYRVEQKGDVFAVTSEKVLRQN